MPTAKFRRGARALATVVACAAVAAVPATAGAKPHHHKKKHKPAPPTYYLALGDSLSRGAQPNTAGTTVPTDQGYPNDLYAAEKGKFKNLKLTQLGCLGETTTSMIHGGVCSYADGNQLATAVKFIKTHKVTLITLDIGANDVDNCAPGGMINLACVSAGIQSINANVPPIVAALRQAAGAAVPIAGMTYYDPFLAYYSQGANGQAVASASVALAKQVNTTLATDFAMQQVKVADVATSFGTYTPFTTTTAAPDGSTEPVAVAQICALTWMCAAAPVGPNIHANATGYRQIATVFEGVL